MAGQRTMRVGAVWVKKTQDGKRYLSISLDGPVMIADPDKYGLVAFANQAKADNANAPDFNLFVSEQQQRNGGGGRQHDDFDDKPGDADPFADA